MSKLEDKLSASVGARSERHGEAPRGKAATKGKSSGAVRTGKRGGAPSRSVDPTRGDGDLNSSVPALHPARIWPD